MLAVVLAGLFLEPEGFSIPEARYFGGQAAIAVDSEPGKKVWLMLDTGSGQSVYNGKLDKGGTSLSFKLGAATIPVLTVRDETFPDSTEPDGSVIAGVIGWDFLQRTQFLLAPASGKLWLRSGSPLKPAEAEKDLRDVEPEAKASKLAILPLKLRDEGFFAEGRVGKKRIFWNFDTGSSSMSLGKKEVESGQGRAVGSRTVSDWAGAEKVADWLLPSVDVGPKHFPLSVVDGQGKDEVGNIVSPLDLARTVLVDLPGKTVYWLEPTAEETKIDSAISRLTGLPVRRLPTGELAVDIEMVTGHPVDTKMFPILVSLQGQSVAELRSLVASAIAGDQKAVDRLAELVRARLENPEVIASLLGKTFNLGKPH